MENKAALVFGGQGSQFTGMGIKIYESSVKARAVFELASSVVGYDIAKMCFEAPQEELNKTIYCQICTLTVELAIYEIFNEKNISFHAVAGFSLGEYAALMAAGVFDMRTAFELVQARATAMDTEIDDNAGRMAAIINLTVDQTESLCKELGNDKVVVANYNSYKQIVVSYGIDHFDELSNKARSLGGRAIPLKVNRPFHHPMMRPAADKYSIDLRKQKHQVPNGDIYLNVTGEKHNKNDSLADKLYEQIFMPVQWIRTVKNMLADGINTFYEVSPKSTLNAFITNISNEKAKIIDVQNIIIAECENA